MREEREILQVGNDYEHSKAPRLKYLI